MFGIITINYKRPQIFHLWCASIKRLRSELGINFPVVVVSEPEDREMCDCYNIGHIIQTNIPVSEKWNTATKYMQELDMTYIVVSGSDDLFSTDCLRNIMSEMNNDVDLIGLKVLHVYDTDSVSRGTLLRITSNGFFGVGKTIHKRVLDAVNWKPWTYPIPRNWGCDSICHRNISPHVKTTATVEGIIVDCKSHESLNKFSMFQRNRHGILTHKSVFLNILSQEERQILDSIPHLGLPVKFPNMAKRGRTLI